MADEISSKGRAEDYFGILELVFVT